ncbi:uncharacterized protein B0I36DRAFT_349162 [Microdochium trichocladiopsis]|uniref:Uncharacterized protein n=1 Tax=Microdochium trichocladiopsis TaxID=1682393 RepID=A0A9P8Y6W5_9PEZI|nr:uncharacterized protein B0I36DRAFT_349162 [Microdochium trichocladiopsis]KAH7031018.1 hypothetical protein B0I36DRAFT_349162 [Microdochium trichocladiopsis]
MRLSSSTVLVLPLPLLGCLAFPAGSGQNLLESERRESLSRVDRPPFVATRAISPSITNNYLPVIKRDGVEVVHLEGRPVVKRGDEVPHLEGRPVVKRGEVPHLEGRPVVKRGDEVPHLEGRPVVKRGEQVAHVGGGPVDKRSPSIQHVHQIIPPGEIAGDY